MGWWAIKSVASGQIDFDHAKKHNRKLSNAIPGVDTEDLLVNGDGPADILCEALDKVVKEYEQEWGRKPRKEELDAAYNFVANTIKRELEGEDYILTICKEFVKKGIFEVEETGRLTAFCGEWEVDLNALAIVGDPRKKK